jgi:DNA mismatch repair protein MSH6
MMFTTHYHMLVEDFRLNKAIGLYQMACDVVEQTDSEIGKKSVGFNYRFVEGVA